MANCNVIIPTFNRTSNLKRLLYFYSKSKSSFKIIVADSSSNNIKKSNKKLILSFKDLDIKHLSHYNTSVELFLKINDALNHAKEKYCVVCADDDFIMPDYINKSIKFLEKNEDYSIVTGPIFRFYLKSNKNFYWCAKINSKSFLSSEPNIRLLNFFKNPISTLYMVHRTALLKKGYKLVMRYTDDFVFGELLLIAFGLIYGKIQYLNIISIIRETHNSVLYTSKGKQRNQNSLKTQNNTKSNYGDHIPNFIKKGTYNEKYSLFRKPLITHLCKNYKFTIDESEKIIDKFMAYYIPLCKESIFVKTRRLLEYLNVSTSIYAFFKYLYETIFLQRNILAQNNQICNYIQEKNLFELNQLRDHILFYSTK